MQAATTNTWHRRQRMSEDARVLRPLRRCILAWMGAAALLWAGVAAVAAARPAQQPAASVRALRGLSVSQDGGQLLIRLDVDTPVRYETATLANPARYVLDLHGVAARLQGHADFQVDYGPVHEVRVADTPTDAGYVRVMVSLREPTPCATGPAADGQGLVIVVGPRGLGALAAAPDRPSVSGPRLALPGSGFTGPLWRSFLSAVHAEPVVLAAAEPASPIGAARLAASAVVVRPEPLTTSAALPMRPALAERTAAVLPLPAAVERLADARVSEPAARVLAAMGLGEGGIVTPALYQPLLSDTPRLPRPAVRTDAEERVVLASAPKAPPSQPARSPTPVARSMPAVPPTPRAVAPGLASAAITSMWQAPAPTGFELHIETSANVDFRTERLTGPLRYVLHLPDTAITPTCAQELRVQDPVVERVQLVPGRDETSVSILLKEPAACTSYRLPGKTTLVASVTPDQAALIAAAPASAARAGASQASDLIELHFYEADLTAVLVGLGKYSDKSIVASSSVQGTITVDLSGVTFETALDIVTKLQGYDYVLLGDKTYVVGTSEELAKLVPPEQMVAERGRIFTYEPKYAQPTDIADYFDQLKEDLGIEVRAATGLNVVLFKGIKDEATEQEIRAQLERVDKELPPITTLYTLEYLSPEAARKALESYLPEVSVATAGPEVPLQVIQLRGSPAVVAQAEDILKTIDVQPKPVEVPAEALITEVVVIDHGDAVEISNTVMAQFPEGVEVIIHSGGGTEADLGMEGIRDAGGLRRTGMLLVRGERPRVDQALQLIKKLDVALPRVQISASIIEINYTKNATVGLVWSLPGIVFKEGSPVDGWRFGQFTRDPWTFSATLQAVDSRSKTRVLSNPKIVVESTKKGSILVGSIIPFETTVPGEGTVTRSLNFQEVGLGIDITPVVKSDGTIEMFLRPHVSNFGDFTPSGFPRIDTREAETIMWAKDGDTIIIGGLLQEQDVFSTSGIPLLQDFPFVGHLFKQRTKSRQKNELVIMATVELLAPGLADADAPANVVVPPA